MEGVQYLYFSATVQFIITEFDINESVLGGLCHSSLFNLNRKLWE